MHPALRLIFRRRCLNFINVRAAYASKIQTPPTKKSSRKARYNEIPRAHDQYIFLSAEYGKIFPQIATCILQKTFFTHSGTSGACITVCYSIALFFLEVNYGFYFRLIWAARASSSSRLEIPIYRCVIATELCCKSFWTRRRL